MGESHIRAVWWAVGREPGETMTEIVNDMVLNRDAITRHRVRIRRMVGSARFERFITGLIFLNAITLGLETSEMVMSAIGPALKVFDTLVLAIFCAEIGLRIFTYGARFWRDPWSIFDFLVVAIALLPATGPLSVLRALRIIRALRLITAFPSMRRVVVGLFSAIPGMTSVVVLLLLIFYIFSVMATMLFGQSFEEWFGTLGVSAYSLFQIMTLEGWSDGIVRPVMKEYQWAWAFFIPFILITSFVVLNLFIGIIVDAMHPQNGVSREMDKDRQRPLRGDDDKVLSQLRELRNEVRQLRKQMASN